MALYTPLSFWEQDTWFNDVDVVIIGGGIVGMNAALRIKEADNKLQVLILERSVVGTAASTRNAGFSCFGSPSELVDDLEHNSESEVFGLVELRVKGLHLLQNILGVKSLGYCLTGGYEMFNDPDKLQKHTDLLPRLNEALGNISKDLEFYVSKEDHGLANIHGVIANDWEGQIHPGKLTDSLMKRCAAAGIKSIRGLNVDKIRNTQYGVEIDCDQYGFEAKRAIVANNAFAKHLTGDDETKPGRNIVLLTNPISNLKLQGCYHFDKGYVYFRNVGNQLLIGGGRNIDLANETTDAFGSNEKVKQYLVGIIDRHLLPDTNYQIDHEWSGILGFNQSKNPRVERIKPNIFTAVGLGGMGVAIGTLIGRQAGELLLQS